MKLSTLLQMVGAIVFIVGLTILLPAVVALGYGEEDRMPLFAAALVTMAVGAAAHLLGKRRSASPLMLRHKEGFAVVALGWIFATGFGALPYLFYAHLLPVDRLEDSNLAHHQEPDEAHDDGGPGAVDSQPVPAWLTGIAQRGGRCAVARQMQEATPQEIYQMVGPGWEFCSVTNAVFESVSGFTTTGATVITNGLWAEPGRRAPGELPRGLLLWRALTQWLGGMGIIVLSVAIFPLLGVGGMEMYRAEAPGPVTDKLVPRARNTARLLWKAYVVLTVLQLVLMLLGGVPFYDSVVAALCTMATGGFSNLSESTAGFNSRYVESITIVFMVLAGTSFALHYQAIFRQKALGYFKDPEFRFYALVLLGAAVLAAAFLFARGAYPTAGESLRHAVFQVVSITTTTGFASADYELWMLMAPAVPMLLLMLMFFGGCAGSTGGSVKSVRVLVLLKQGYQNLFHLMHPRAIHHLRLAGKVVPLEILRSINGFFALYMMIFAAAALALAGMGVDFMTALSASAASIGNIGPGLAGVGPTETYHHLPGPGLWILSLVMILGRLELYTLLMLALPSFWRR